MATTEAQVGSQGPFSVRLLEDTGNGTWRPKTNPEGADNFSEYVQQVVIEESIDFPCIRGTMVMIDNADIFNMLMGNELWEIQASTPTLKTPSKYVLQCHAITDRIKRDKTNVFTIHLVSPEFLFNEVTNVFGSFKDKPFSDHVKTVITSKKGDGLQSKKETFIEATRGNPQFVVPNWRPLDTISWMATKSVRSASGSGTKPQGAYIFYENVKGFHFKSLDKMIEEARDKTDCYHYKYQPKRTTEDSAMDTFTITRLSFPKTYDTLANLRNGTWAGYSMELNMQDLTRSKMTSAGKDIGFESVYYSIDEYYKRMSHLSKRADVPIDVERNSIASLFSKTPKRVKFGLSGASLYTGMSDTVNYKKSNNSNEMNTPELRAYNYMRRYVLEQIQLQIDVPGNLDLRCGEGIEIDIPATVKSSDRVDLDRVYSGRYLIAGVTHVLNVTNCVSTLMCYKDYVDKK